MAISLSTNLNTEMNSLTRTHAAKATVERWLPEWTPKITGLSTYAYEQYAHGHAAAVAVNGNGTGEDVIFRARSGSWANPFDQVLYIAVIKGSDLNDPTTWDSKWVSSGVGGLMRPAWYNNTESEPASNGGSIAAVWSGSFFRVFFILEGGGLYYRDYNTSGALVTGSTLIASLGTNTYSITSMQIASCNYTELFVLRTELVENSEASWHKPIYGTHIHRYSGNGSSWSDWPAFPFHNQAEAALVRDSQLDYGSVGVEWGGGSAGDIITQWGKRPCGGLAANEIDSNTVVVSAGFTFWRRYGYNTHNQGIMTFIYHRNSAQWQRGIEVDLSDFVTERLDYALFARGSKVETGSNVLVWSRYVEPSDYDQLNALLSLPRVKEVVYAKFDPTGRALTQYQYLADPSDMTAAAIVAVNHAGAKKLYALGWRSVYESPAAALLCSVPAPDDLELYVDGFKTSVNNRYGMSVDLNVEDASVLFQPDSPLQPGRLVKVYAGTPSEQVQIAQGLVDTINPSFSLSQEAHRAKLVARAEKGLLDPRSEELSEIMPQNTEIIAPSDPIVHVANHKGMWETVKMEWPTKFFAAYNSLQGKYAYRLRSFPYAYTGGDQGYGYPGMVLDQRPTHKGTWWNDAAWTDLSPMVDGSIEATVRFGDVNNGGNFSFYDRNKNQVFAVVSRSSGNITTITWHTGSYGGPVFNTVKQNASMAGLICHAAEMNKKFAFVWEASTLSNAVYTGVDKVPSDWLGYPKPFSASSHTDDTWRAETMDRCDFRGYALGPNKLYLILSDYDDSDPDWQKNSKWIHRVVAGGIDAVGLVPGQPADLKMVVSGGTIFCFYRPYRYDGNIPNQWQFAFSYKAGRFGAGRFGIVGRGHAGIQWDAFYYAYQQANPLPTGRNVIPKYDNYVDFWNIKVSDAVMDRPMEEVLRRRCWQGFTPTTFTALVNDAAPPAVGAGGAKSYSNIPVENLTLDFKATTAALGGEYGVVCRAVDPTNVASKQHIRIGLEVNGGLPGATGVVTSFAIKRVYDANGAEITTEREYAPSPIYLHNTWPLPVRVTVRGNVYSIWVAGNYIGHFVDDTPGGLYFGLYALGAAATFTNVYVPELYEVLENSTLEVNQTIFDAIKSMIGKRALKGVFQPSGALKLSYFETHDAGPSFMDTLKQSAVRLSDRFFSIVRVDGAYTFAVYASEVLLKYGRRFMQVSFPDIFHREFCYREARNLCIRAAEDQVQTTFIGTPDYRVQPEDKIEIIVEQQNIAGHFLVDDVTHTFQLDQDDPTADSEISTRQYVVI